MNSQEVHDRLWKALSQADEQTLRDEAFAICKEIEKENEPPVIDPKAEQFVKKYYDALIVKNPPKTLYDIGSIA